MATLLSTLRTATPPLCGLSRIYVAAKQSSWLTRALIVVNPEDPCVQWQSAAIVAGVTDQDAHWRREIIGHEVVGGRETTVFRAKATPNQGFVAWIAPTLWFPLRARIGDITVEVQGLEEAPQPAHLFEIPKHALRSERSDQAPKQSDVWVEDPSP